MKIAIIGYGKMGKAIERLATQKHEIVLKVNSGNKDELTIENLQKADVIIEFSRPESAFENIKLALASDVPIISGTTGWLSHKAEIESICKEHNGTFLYASNFSLGVNLFFTLNKKLAQLMESFPQYKASMQEIHHVHKLDSPSGTGITLAEGIIDNHKEYEQWSKEEGEAKNIFIDCKREGEVPGTHSVEYKSDVDRISITHEAFTRDSFAMGALFAAEWVQGKKGILTMEDLMKDQL